MCIFESVTNLMGDEIKELTLRRMPFCFAQSARAELPEDKDGSDDEKSIPDTNKDVCLRT